MTKPTQHGRESRLRIILIAGFAGFLIAPPALEVHFQDQRLACFLSLQEMKASLSLFKTRLGEPISTSGSSSSKCHDFDLQLYSRGVVCEEGQGGGTLSYIEWRDPAGGFAQVLRMTGDLYESFFNRLLDDTKPVPEGCKE